MTKLLTMPNPSVNTTPLREVLHNGTVVIIGANGTGKSRLGHWFEQSPDHHGVMQSPFGVRRISAQRFTTLPLSVQRLPLEHANQLLERGGDATKASRVNGDPIVGIMEDSGLVLNALFAERDAQALAFYDASKDASKPSRHAELSILDRALALWQQIFPERELTVEGGYMLLAKAQGTYLYDGTQLSDGERAGFYLISHALLAEPSSTLLIDEPELHLHESIQSLLWNALEAERQDCNFIYITHDLGFAASRINATKVLLRSFEHPQAGPYWEWELAPEVEKFPEDVLLRIVGSRRPVIFVEGEMGSPDQELYEAAYPDHYVVPGGGCQAVIKTVQTFRDHAPLHRYKASGIIDGDDRDIAERKSLADQNIRVLEYAQVENILISPEVMNAYLKHMGVDGVEAARRIALVEERVLEMLRNQRDKMVAQRAMYAVERRLHKISPATDRADLVQAVNNATAAADPEGAYDDAAAIIDGATSGGNYEEVLKVLRSHGTLAVAAAALGIKPGEYRRTVIHIIRTDEVVRASLNRLLPVL